MQAMIRFWNYLATLYLARKIAYRYRQTEHCASKAAGIVARNVLFVELRRLGGIVVAALNGAAAWIGRGSRAAATRTVALLSKIPLFGGIVRRYDAHYDEANRQPSARFSEKVRGFFGRWSIKFTADYYEARDRDAAKGHAGV